ncbi:MAG: MBL fold metallo-hydrolase [bacterium]
MEIIFLGTGTSHGVPLIGRNCETCNSSDIKNIRYRCSLYIKYKNLSILIDTPQELRLQLLNNSIKYVDLVLYTHPHADHLLGFDDIRSINKLSGKEIPCYGNEYTINEIKRVFPYIHDAVQKGGGLPEVNFNLINKTLTIDDIDIIPLPVKHGKLDILGYRIGKLAYITDCSYIPDSTYSLLRDIKLLIIGALRYRKHKTHMNIDEAVDIIKTLKVPRAFFTHMSHNIEYNKLKSQLPDFIKPAYDGLKIEI